jgi:hypothetical protein
MKAKVRRGFYFNIGRIRIGFLRAREIKVLPKIELGELHGKRICGQLVGEVFWAFLWWYGWLAW